MALPIAIMMVVIVGVMGAGLLTFVVTDLRTVVEVNQGQKAFDIADAGVQLAKAQLRKDSFRQHYDMFRDNDCIEPSGIRVGPAADNWSPSTETWQDNSNCSGTQTSRATTDVGVTRNFGGGKFRVTIQCYPQYQDPSPSPCSGISDPPPEPYAKANDRKFFKIISRGYSSVSGNGAVRKIEAIYYTGKIGQVPPAYFTPKNINFNGGPALKRLSFFAGGNITGTTQGSITKDRTTTALYGDWNNPPYNTVGRIKPPADGGGPAVGVGFGALGFVCGGSTCSGSDLVADGYYDYDSTTGSKGQNKKFVLKSDPTAALGSNEISFPFDPGTAISNPSTVVSSALLDELKAAAQEQNNYFTPGGAITITSWPGPGAIYFVDGQDVTFKVNSTPAASGVLVVRNGNFTLSNASSGFKGIVIVIGNGTSTGNYTTIGNTALDGFAIASGSLTFGGDVTPNTTTDYTNLLNLYNVKLWSWRELYS